MIATNAHAGMVGMVLGFIGLGVMGEPMCRNLRLRSGARVVAYDVAAAPLERLAEHGVESAANAAVLARAADVVFVALPSDSILDTLVHAADGLLAGARPGQVYVDLGTSPVALSRALAGEFAERGADYLDAPVARTRAAAEAGTLAAMVGGSVEAFERVRPLLACFASDITHCGAVGLGQLTKILNNMVLFQTVTALAEAHAIARAHDADPARLFETLTKGSADSFALRNHGLEAMVPGQFPERAFSVRYAQKDLGYALELAALAGIDAASAKRVAALFVAAIEQGYGEQYFPVISRLFCAGD